MDVEEEEMLLALAGLYVLKKRKSRPKRFWIRKLLSRRPQQGEYHQLMQEMRLADSESFFMYMRMSKERFDLLLAKVIIYV